MFRLTLMRGIVLVFTASLAAWYYATIAMPQQQYWLIIFAVFFTIWVLLQQWYLFRIIREPARLFLQLLTDVVIIACFLFVSGGFQSPFVLLFGLIIVVAGTQGRVLLVIAVSVASCIAYLLAIYAHAWWQETLIPADATLKLLLEISVMLLIGGIMAAIAGRQSGLQQESRQAVRQHKHLQEVHSKLLASMQEGVLVLSKDLRIRDSNLAARQLLHVPEDVAEVAITDIWPMSRRLLVFLQQTEDSEDYFQCEWHVHQEVYLISARMLPGDDIHAYWLITFVDVSELRSLESQLLEQEKLAAMGRMSAMLAHEFRNPMQTIGQAVDLFGKVEESQYEDIRQIIKEEVGRLNRLVGDMLDYSKPLNAKPVLADMQQLIKAAIHHVDAEQVHAIEMHVTIKSLFLDEQHFRLVLDNLLQNAIQASPEQGSVCVSLQQVSAQNWQLKIKDHGHGIPDSFRGKIFEPFATRRAEGTGLGMATVWQTCQANDWEIEIADQQYGAMIIVTGALQVAEHG